jgi:hypothetical protein
MVGRVLLGLVVMTILGVTAGADEEPSKVWMPTGAGWWCFDALVHRGEESAHTSACYRSKHTCVELAATNRRAAIESSERFLDDAFQCMRLKKAVGFTARDVVQDDLRHWQFPHPEECESMRRLFVTRDYDHVSPCDIAGDVERSRFQTDLVPKGKGWFCSHNDTGQSACRRKKAECAEAAQKAKDGGQNVSTCAFQASAYGVTSQQDVFVVESQDACEDIAEELPEASRCTKL